MTPQLRAEIDALPEQTMALFTIPGVWQKTFAVRDRDGWSVGMPGDDTFVNLDEVTDFDLLRIADRGPIPLTIQPPDTTPSLWFVDDGYAVRLDNLVDHGLEPRQLFLCRALLENARGDIDLFIEDL